MLGQLSLLSRNRFGFEEFPGFGVIQRFLNVLELGARPLDIPLSQSGSEFLFECADTALGRPVSFIPFGVLPQAFLLCLMVWHRFLLTPFFDPAGSLGILDPTYNLVGEINAMYRARLMAVFNMR